MLYFESDYTEGAHPTVLAHLIDTNMEHASGYGTDPFCEAAKQKIRAACNTPDADIFFLVGGTQTTRTVISALLAISEGVIAADTGHIALHEAGAIEHTGHKVLPIPQKHGKISAETLAAYLKAFYADENHPHMVQPGMVYISYPTEYGTLYTKEELSSIHAVCRTYGLPLYVDGARLGYGLASNKADLTLSDFAERCDVFYIGGTKVGALCGEAVVFPRGNAPRGFFTTVKQNGALLAKGRLLGVQFDALFTNDLYSAISRHAIDCAAYLRSVFSELGFRFYLDTPTNQLFLVLENAYMRALSAQVRFSYWEPYDKTHSVVRFATSWATEMRDIDALRTLLMNNLPLQNA